MLETDRRYRTVDACCDELDIPIPHEDEKGWKATLRIMAAYTVKKDK